MSIISATFMRDGTTIAVTLSDGTVLFVPDDVSNSQRAELARWEAEGNQIAPYVAPAPTPAQQRLADFLAQSDRADLAQRLANATPAQIDTWIDNNVTSLAAARNVLKALVKFLVV